MQRLAIGAVHGIQRGDDAEIERRLRNRLAIKYRGRKLVALANEGGGASTLHEARMKEMDHPAAVGNVDPALDQQRVGPAVTVFDNLIPQTVLAYQVRVETPRPIVVPVKADIVVLRQIIVREVTSAAAEKHPRARGIAIA